VDDLAAHLATILFRVLERCERHVIPGRSQIGSAVNSRNAGRSKSLSALAIFVLLLHALFILWIVFGVVLTHSRPVLRWLHIASLVWGVLTELLPWSCPLTLLENWLQGKAGVEPYQGGFLLHYLDKLVYPGMSVTALTVLGLLICVLNLALYGRRLWIAAADSFAGRALVSLLARLH